MSRTTLPKLKVLVGTLYLLNYGAICILFFGYYSSSALASVLSVLGCALVHAIATILTLKAYSATMESQSAANPFLGLVAGLTATFMACNILILIASDPTIPPEAYVMYLFGGPWILGPVYCLIVYFALKLVEVHDGCR